MNKHIVDPANVLKIGPSGFIPTGGTFLLQESYLPDNKRVGGSEDLLADPPVD
jgi:hypothetical protein